MPSTLAYWPAQLLGHPIRFLLNYVGEEFEDKYYRWGPAPDFSKDEWTNEKFNLGLDFPNLPYYIDDHVKLSQSNTILRYLGRKYKLGGETEQEKIRVDLALDQVQDNRWAMTMMCYNPDFAKLKDDFDEQIPLKLKLYDDFIGDYPYMAGQKVTVADFPMFALLKEHQLFVPGCLDDFPKLRAFIDRIQNLPAIKKYMESDAYPKLNYLGVSAVYGSDMSW